MRGMQHQHGVLPLGVPSTLVPVRGRRQIQAPTHPTNGVDRALFVPPPAAHAHSVASLASRSSGVPPQLAVEAPPARPHWQRTGWQALGTGSFKVFKQGGRPGRQKAAVRREPTRLVGCEYRVRRNGPMEGAVGPQPKAVG